MTVEELLTVNSRLLKMFMEVNPTVEVLDAEPDVDPSVPSAMGHYLKVTTKNHGWLHVYVNKDNGQLEWY